MSTKKKPPKITEAQALAVLRNEHGYMFHELSNKRERWTMSYSHRTDSKKATLTPAVSFRITVNEDTELGKEIVAFRKGKDREAKKKEREREKRKAVRMAARLKRQAEAR